MGQKKTYDMGMEKGAGGSTASEKYPWLKGDWKKKGVGWRVTEAAPRSKEPGFARSARVLVEQDFRRLASGGSMEGRLLGTKRSPAEVPLTLGWGRFVTKRI